MRRARLMVFSALAVLVAAEGAARLVQDRLPEPTVWFNIESQQKSDQMDALQGGAAVALVGTSQINGDVDPVALGSILGTTVYNAGLSAGLPPLTVPWTERVVIPRLRPRTLVYGVNSFDFYDHPSGVVFFQQMADSPAGERALGRQSLLDRIDWGARGLSVLWSHREDLRLPSALLDVVLDPTTEREAEFGPVTPGGRTVYSERQRPSRVDEQGRTLPPRAGTVPVDGWELGTRSRALIRSLIEDAQAAGIRVVLLDMPVSATYVERHPRGEADYDRFRTALRELATDTGVDLLEYDSMRDAALFADQVHLTDEGAAIFTEQLGRDLRRLGVT